MVVRGAKGTGLLQIGNDGRGARAECVNLRILAVDDDMLVLMSTAAMIEDLGHAALEASSGEAALALLRGGAEVDMVITDQAMPAMTGVELAVAIAREWPHIPVLVATGYSELPPGSPPLPLIGKPFAERDLARAIEGALLPES